MSPAATGRLTDSLISYALQPVRASWIRFPATCSRHTCPWLPCAGVHMGDPMGDPMSDSMGDPMGDPMRDCLQHCPSEVFSAGLAQIDYGGGIGERQARSRNVP